MVRDSDFVAAQLGDNPEDDAECKNVEGNVKAAAEIVADCVGADVKDDGDRRTCRRD